jgi:hypothetical protein
LRRAIPELLAVAVGRFDIAKSLPAPTATEALKRIAELDEIEGEIRGKSADERRAVRQQKTKPLAEESVPRTDCWGFAVVAVGQPFRLRGPCK